MLLASDRYVREDAEWQVAVCCDSSVTNQNVTSRTTLQIEVAAP